MEESINVISLIDEIYEKSNIKYRVNKESWYPIFF
jgi:hypothetical protein